MGASRLNTAAFSAGLSRAAALHEQKSTCFKNTLVLTRALASPLS